MRVQLGPLALICLLGANTALGCEKLITQGFIRDTERLFETCKNISPRVQSCEPFTAPPLVISRYGEVEAGNLARHSCLPALDAALLTYDNALTGSSLVQSQACAAQADLLANEIYELIISDLDAFECEASKCGAP